MNIASLIESEANVQIVVTLSDLKEFALAVVSEAMAAKEAEKKEEKYLTPDDVADMVGVSKKYFVAMGKREISDSYQGRAQISLQAI